MNASTYPGLYKYNATVAKSANATALSPVFTTLTVSTSLTNADLATIGTTKTVVVKAYAIQADNLGATDTAALAWAAMH